MRFPNRYDRWFFLGGSLAALIAVGIPSASCSATEPGPEPIEAGERLVHNLDCNACHTPKVFTEHGPELDPSRLLSGHPGTEKIPAIPEGLIGPQGWGGLFNNHLTAWAGPWGVSFAGNLTPDMATGIGAWSEEDFAERMRTGPFRPPMPTYARLTDDELRAIFAYLRSIRPIVNEVPDALPPQLVPGAGGAGASPRSD